MLSNIEGGACQINFPCNCTKNQSKIRTRLVAAMCVFKNSPLIWIMPSDVHASKKKKKKSREAVKWMGCGTGCHTNKGNSKLVYHHA